MAEDSTITTIFKADISQFSASTQQLNAYVKMCNSEFNNATASLGKWSDSTDGLTAKINQLNGHLDVDKKKLADLEAQYNALTDEQKKNTIQGQKLGAQINDQRAKVQKTEKQIGDYSKSLKELQDAGVSTRQELDALNSKIKDNGKEAESTAGKIAKGLGKGLLGVATATAGAVTGFLALGESTRETRTTLGQLETSFTQAGFSAETAKKTYEDFNSILGDTSKSTETLQHLAQMASTEEDLSDYTKILTGVYATFGESLPTEGLAEAMNHTAKLGEVQGNLADALEWAGVSTDEFNEKLASCNSEQERAELINTTLMGLYGETAEAYQKNNKDVIGAEKAQTRLTNAMAQLGAVAEPIMTALKNAFADLLEAIAPAVQVIGEGLKGAFEGSSEGASKLAEGLSQVVSTLVDKAMAILPTLLEVIAEVLPKVVQSIIDTLVPLLPSIIDSAIDALLKMLPSLLDCAVTLLSALVEAIPSVINSLVNKLPTIIEAIVNTLMKNLPAIIKAGVQLLMGLIKAIPQIQSALIQNMPQIISSIVSGLIEGVPEIFNVGIELIKGLWEGIKSMGSWIGDKIKGFGKSIVDGFKGFFGIHSPSKLFQDQIGKNLALGIGEGFGKNIKGVTEGMEEAFGKVMPTLDMNVQAMNGFGGLQLAIANGSPSVKNVTNNYMFDYTFEKMETTQYALHKARIETKRLIGG